MCPLFFPPSSVLALQALALQAVGRWWRVTEGPSLGAVMAMMRERGVRRLLVKFLSPNDNSKNQIYLGGDLGVVNLIPAGEPVAGTAGTHAEPIFKAPLAFAWLDEAGHAFPAPHSQLILYPQYPEVRMSGFLKGAKWSPSALLTVRDPGRVLILGVTSTRSILGFASGASSAVAGELRTLDLIEDVGVFKAISLISPVGLQDSRVRLLAELCRVSRAGWIPGWKLQPDGSRKSCVASNCVGVTLESELGILANSRSEPDFEGWEVKGHTVRKLERPSSGPITLMTPEPNGGCYATEGVVEFVRRYGYKDKRGREDRFNFGGIHRVGVQAKTTRLSLELRGFDRDSQTLTRSDGELALVTSKGVVAASWSFAGLLAHWSRKHARAAYVPAIKRREPTVSYRYGENVLLAEGTDYLRLLVAIADGVVFYDPGIKVEDFSGTGVPKKRSQFRVAKAQLTQLYHTSYAVESCREYNSRL